MRYCGKVSSVHFTSDSVRVECDVNQKISGLERRSAEVRHADVTKSGPDLRTCELCCAAAVMHAKCDKAGTISEYTHVML